MKVSKMEKFGTQEVYNTNVKIVHNYISEGGIINHNCVIDSEYRSNVHAHLFNNSDNEVHFDIGDKITQFIVVPVGSGVPQLVDSIDINTDRGEGGFGSSGRK